MATIWHSVSGATWDDVTEGDRISIAAPGIPDLGMAQELGITGNVTRLTDAAVELNGMLVIPKEDYTVHLVIRGGRR